MTKRYFIAGTDTEVGKTYATCLMINALVNTGYKVAGLKPVASDSQLGSVANYNGLVNDDALKIKQAANLELTYPQVNPLVFEQPIAPHIAALEQGVSLSCETLNEKVAFPKADVCLIEGAGGWLTPLNKEETYADWVDQNQLEVILVVGMKLGCLNHAQLTAQAIKARGLKLKGWVANQIEPNMAHYDQNLDWLKSYFEEPLLAEVKYKQAKDDFKIQSIAKLVD